MVRLVLPSSSPLCIPPHSPSTPPPTQASPHPSGWSRHVNQSDGRPYWSHPQHGSSWTKPRDLKSPLELELENSPWDEYETNGRKYWVHKESKETTWNMPTDISGPSPLLSSTSTRPD